MYDRLLQWVSKSLISELNEFFDAYILLVFLYQEKI